MDSMELLYDHYKESYGLSKEAQSNRNKAFMFLCIALAINLLFVFEPSSILLVLTSWLNESHGIDFSLQVEIIQVFLWLVLLYFTIRYIQLNCYIERQYKYIHQLESRISNISEVRIDRESENYLKSYPKVLDGIYVVYTWMFPILYVVATTFKIIVEIRASSIKAPIVISLLIYICCSILFVLYFCFLRKMELESRHTKKSGNAKTPTQSDEAPE